jgi:hypothetical protein
MINTVFLLLVVLTAGCFGSDDQAPPRRESPHLGFGEACRTSVDCREGLTCGEEDTCAGIGEGVDGARCDFTGDCGPGLFCGPDARCETGGEAAEGAACGTTAECTAGLVCVLTSFTGRCLPGGSADLNAACESSIDCLAGFGCGVPLDGEGVGAVCLPPGQAEIPEFEGVSCQGDSSTLDPPLRMYFEIPGSDSGEFYRLPFPNDARLVAGRPDLAAHPTPGLVPLGFDAVRTYADAVTASQDGFGLNQSVLMRFSGRLDFASLMAGGESPTHYLVDITPGSNEYNQLQPVFWQAATAGNKYICHNWLAMRPSTGRPLNANTTYAAIVTGQARGEDGSALVADDHFAAMLSGNRPSGTLGAPWDVYEPLRDWMRDQEISTVEIVGAAVFTTGDPRAVTRALRAAVHETSAPALGDLVKCDTQVTSPCDDGLDGEAHTRGCFAAAANVHELHTTISLPQFQEGEVPFVDDGGSISLDDGPRGRAAACASLLVPDEEAPEAGWPAIVYAHDTGQDFRSHAETLGPLLVAGGDTQQRFVILAWDQLHHGSRAAGVAIDPETLMFNYGNPAAAVGNWQQGAAEVYAMVLLARSLNVLAEDSPTGRAIRIDPERVYFMGHGQGGVTGAMALPFEPDVRAAVFSATGGGRAIELRFKGAPVNLAAGVRTALHEESLGSNHPVINLLQAYLDPTDPVNYAEYLGAHRMEGETTPRHVLHTIGVGDTLLPAVAQEAFASGLRSVVVAPLYEPFESRSVEAVEPPVTATHNTGGETFTIVTRQYRPGEGDGHLVAFEVDAARDDVAEFLDSAATLGTPVITD